MLLWRCDDVMTFESFQLKLFVSLCKTHAMTCDFQPYCILTSVVSDKPVQSLLSLETPNDVQSVA